ncbi:right-handed parallel beta-helix repeat-containing protein [Methanobrevibacter sp.]|uniref:right-handed parallel beta-helix repeat-containing protein n=1 Tax=Methanobrevibacter sp. TaxID=66852 RepID=UPI00386CBB37
MNKKGFIVVLFVIALLSLNFCVAQEIDNSTSEDLSASVDDEVLAVHEVNESALQASSKVNTHIDVEGNTNFDVIGDYFKVKLNDANGKVLANTKLTFALSGKTYTRTTDNNGIASLQLRLNDGTYTITTKFAGNTNYRASSLATTVTMTNTRVVDAGLSSSEIQKIIDNAKVNNVILFKGPSYSDVNLVITKSLTLISEVDTVLKSSAGTVITIKGKGASLTTIKGFKIQSAGNGIVIKDAEYVKIIKNDISGKGNAIVATGTKYLNITKNNIVKNSKNGISLADSSYAYIFNNDIKNNDYGIEVAKSNNVYIYGNTIMYNKYGVHLSKKINDVNYGEGPSNVYISKNTINVNEKDAIMINNAGDNINIKSNEIDSNHENGISIAHIGNFYIQSNVISSNWGNGIQFFDGYVKPNTQEISYNAIHSNLHTDVEAKDSIYESGSRLQLGDNWYTDYSGICPKIQSNNIKFSVKQVGPNQFQATFVDSNGNIASLLPDRTLTYTTANGNTLKITVSGGTAVFNVDANDGDLVESIVDNSKRDNIFDSKTKIVPSSNGQSPSYTYPTIPNYQLYEDIGTGGGNGNGDGSGDGSGGNANRGNGASKQDSSSNGNSTHSQKSDPASNANNQVNDVSQSYDSQSSAQAGASEASSGDTGNPGSQSESVVKQIIFDEDEFFKVTGISFIVLLMVLTVGFYYRDDIKEMNSKR